MYRVLATAPLLAATALAAPAAPAKYDYIVVGGGTSGLVVANRLSELNNVTVAVIEAGGSVFTNENVTNPNGYGLAFGTPIDWAYESVNQTYGGGKTQTLRAGKALGGTSTINGMAYTRAEDAQVDAWEAIGNTGWNWASLLPYYKKSERVQPPKADQLAGGATYDPAFHGTSGPLKVGWKNGMMNISFPEDLNQTYAANGVPYIYDIAGGKMAGWNVFPSTLDVDLNVREDAARAYYFPFENRTNYHVLLNTEAQKLVWAESGAEATASGVLVKDASGNTRTIYANKEVILSAGSLKSPVLLELSGVGNADILKAAGVEVKVDLPAVGENLQDQTNNGFKGVATKAFTGNAVNVAYPNVEDIFGNKTLTVAADVKKSLQKYAEEASAYSNGVVAVDSLTKFFDIQYDLIFKDKVPLAEVLIYPTDTAFSAEFWSLLPFARGNVHIASADAASAKINPNYYMFDWDMTEQIGTAKYIRQLFGTAPLSTLLANETSPGAAVASDAQFESWILENYRSNFHPVGTTAMMPKELGGVVDPSLKVYGTSNVRVVDAGVLPFQVCGHLVSTLYAVAEKASDIIKAEA
ncbi:putative glucose oxidase protein [Neofusicoccum parvum UCRNP2]|uniref:Putative glucose oxidase protein n=1 Tax=Botryosphaeria parva (strain UCR-NP2) TaxID=1287680 RepID=R1EZF7_BOTPV|nr:putative glucose oxidase protein [Neofusicoccum parvum UCRNP2]